MKKLLSITLVMIMVITSCVSLITIPSVSAADAIGDYLVADFKTVAKIGFETGDASPNANGGNSYNVFTTGSNKTVYKDGTTGKAVNLKATVVAYQDAGISAPVSEGETFGSNVAKFDFDANNVVGYERIRGRIPFAISDTAPIEAGKLYRVSVWVKVDKFGAEGATTGQISLAFGDNINSESTTWMTVNKGEWNKLLIEYTPKATHATSNMFILGANGANGAPTIFYVDNFRIEELQETKAGSEIVAYTSFGASSGTAAGTGTDTTYAIAGAGSSSFPTATATGDQKLIYDTYVANANTFSYPTSYNLHNEASPAYYPGMPMQIFKKTSTNGAWLVRFSKTFDASDIAAGDKVRMSVEVFATDVVAHAKKKDGTIGGPVELETYTMQMFPTAGSGNDQNTAAYRNTFSAPVGQWYRAEKVFTVDSGWKSTGFRIDGTKQQTNMNAYNEPFASTVYFANYKYEKITDTNEKVNVGVSSEIAGLTVTGAGEYNVGSSATVTAPATAENGAKEFMGWYDGYVCVSTSPSYTFTAVTPINLVARYRENKMMVTLSTNGQGSVEGAGEYSPNTTATIKANPDDGYVFDGWYDSSKTRVSKNAEYTFNVTSDVEYKAYFIKAPVNGWSEVAIVNFDSGNGSPAANTNFWGRNSSNANANGTHRFSTYEAEGISKPNTTDDFGTGLIILDSTVSNNNDNVTGVHQGRIDNIPTSVAETLLGETYKASAWVYLAETFDETATSESFDFYLSVDGANYGPSYVNVNLPKGQWTYIEAIGEITDASNVGKTLGARFMFNAGTATAPNGGAPKLMYIDNVKIEKFDGVTVTAEATNGTVYGTGAYAKGESVTLNAGANAGYKFAGYYKKDTDEPLSAEPKYTFTVTDDTTVVAKFVEEEAYVYPSNVLYHFGSETGDVGINNNWMYLPTGANGAYKQDSAAPYNKTISYHDLAAEGIYRPEDSAKFGSQLYQQKRLDGDIKTQVAGRFRGWENGSTGVSTKYKAGHLYKFTWWVYPVSMQLANGETAQPATTKLSITMTYNGSNESKLGTHTWTLNVGEWNKLEWEFQANETVTTIAPGLRYDWDAKENNTTELLTVVNWALYDEIQVEEITSWQWGDTANPNNTWYKYADQADLTAHTTSSNNISAHSLVKYSEEGINKASDDAGDYVVKMDYSKPEFTEEAYNNNVEKGLIEGDYTAFDNYADAYAHLSRLANYGGDIGMRFNTIVPKGVLAIGNTYKISAKVYIAEKKTIATGDDTTSVTSVKIIGTHTGSNAVGDGKTATVNVPFGEWTEVSYTFKATEAGVDYAPSLKIEVGKNSSKEFPTVFYIDDVRVDMVHVDKFDLQITEDDTTVTATASVFDIKSGDTVNAVVIIAAYDADGKLVSVSFSNNGASKAVAINDSISATYPKADGIDKYVAFLWDDLTNIRPYVLPVTLGE